MKLPNQQIYQGEFCKGKMRGNGVLRGFQKQEIFNGCWIDNRKSGFGRETMKDGSKYEGNYEKDFKQGYGKYLWPDGSQYEGHFVRDVMHGKGSYSSACGR